MPVIKLVSPYGDADVPLLRRLVKFGEDVEVTDEQAEVLLAQVENWQPVDEDAQVIADAHAKRMAGVNDNTPPAKNASHDEWIGYGERQGDPDAASKTRKQLIADHGGDQ